MTKIVLSDNQELAVCAALLPRSGATLATCRRLFHTPDKAHTASIVERIKALSLAIEEERNGKVLLIPTPQNVPNALQRVYFRKIKEAMIKTLTPRQITQLVTLSSHGDYESGDLFCSVEKVADWLHISQRQAIRLLKSMQQSGLITRISRGHYVLNYVEISSTAVAKRCAVAVQEVTTTPPPAELQEDTPTPPAYQEETPPAEMQEETPETTPPPATPAAVQPADHDRTTPASTTAPTPPPPAKPQDVRDIARRIGAQRRVFEEEVKVCRELEFGGWYLDEGQKNVKGRGTMKVKLTAEQLAIWRHQEQRATYEDYLWLLVALNDYYKNDIVKWEQDARTLATRLTISRLQLAAYLATNPAPVRSLNLNSDILMQTAAGVERWVREQRGATKGNIMKQIERSNAADHRTA